MEDILTHVHETIHGLMKERGVGVSELARRMGRSKAQVSVLLSGKKGMTVSTLDRIFNALGYTMGFSLIENGKFDNSSDDDSDPALD